MESLVILRSSLEHFEIPFQRSFSFAGNIVDRRFGFYLTLTSSNNLTAIGEAAPLPGLSSETIRKTQHDLEEIQLHLKDLEISLTKKDLIDQLRQDQLLKELCPSAKFAVESAIFSLAAQFNKQSLAEFLDSNLDDVYTAGLLQGTYEQVINDAKRMTDEGFDIFKLKVGDRNIPLDVKKVTDLRAIIGEDGLIRLDGNRVWSLKEALLFMELIGSKQIEFIEEPLSDLSQLNEFYQRTHIPVALDETLSVLKCGITAPGRCSPTLAQHEAVQAYILKPMILGGIIPTLDWMEEATSSGRKAIISSCFESPIGLKVLANLALLTGQVAGLGTDRWLKCPDIVNEQGIILKDLLK